MTQPRRSPPPVGNGQPPIVGGDLPGRSSNGGGSGGSGGGLDGAGQSAYDVLVAMLRDWGLDELAPDVLRLLQDGHTQDQVSLLLQDTSAYKRRFAGNELRRKAGLPVLSPKEYLATEASYRQIMESAGLPSGFYDQPSDFAQWIGGDVSPSEIQSRVGYAVDAAQRLDDGTKQAFREFYGVGPNDLAAFFLDRTRALPQIQRIARGAQIAGAEINNGLSLTRDRVEQLANSGVADSDLRQAAGEAAALSRDVGLASREFGGSYTQTDAENEAFFNDAAARQKRQRLAAAQTAQFDQGSGALKGSLVSGNNY